MRLLIWPREHGAWGILGVSLLTGAAAGMAHGGRPLALLFFVVAVLSVFCLRTPLESLLGNTSMRAQTASERWSAARAVVAFSAIALLAATGLFWGGRNLALLALAAMAGYLYMVQGMLRKLGRSARMAAQLVGAIGLTSTAAGAFYVMTGQFSRLAFSLWLMNWVFAGNQIHFVQVRIHSARLLGRTTKLARGRVFLAFQLVMMLALAWYWRQGLVSALAVGAFIPIFVRGVAWFLRPPVPLDIRRLGLSELAHALVFGALLTAGFCLTGV
ncbi:MAG: YwiC-like family protein [Terriglobales bacterium]|jgi:hypothetical protein